ncbi:pirin-like protein [Telopea speciosissima]|uniref:pirin-like protein n=1 Tax=Telopea speciosissima TaxID=54955 RepID=UPI001CC60518|nr:pirin-like protein [Telopea speciosissima]
MVYVHCTIAHALEKIKYPDSDIYWKKYEDKYHSSSQFTAGRLAMNHSDFIITSTYQEIAGRGGRWSFDPFLVLDEFFVTAPTGFPDHPHRGFETVTYMLEGAFTHQDFAGHKGTIRTGDLHVYMLINITFLILIVPGSKIQSQTHRIEPNYQELGKEDIKTLEEDGVEVRVIVGEAMSVCSPVYTPTLAIIYISLLICMNEFFSYKMSLPNSLLASIPVLPGNTYKR